MLVFVMPNSNQYMLDYMSDRRFDRRMRLIEMLGGKCVDCGSMDELQFDHVDPNTKSFSLSGAGLDTSWNKILKELKKCVLRCDTCHRTKTYKFGEGSGGHNKGLKMNGTKYELVHGTAIMYNVDNCRCIDCKYAKALYRTNKIGYHEIVIAPSSYIGNRGRRKI